ncbi:5-formyltetrahydrofolate cyclo-ligase [Eggerthella sp. YY7918]|uniref:5-formyltetrahydrofolate cyclo-ligase n=1 Tax=Eggerthella sp. (strain YY7918) TaxID=502558 RepID=UPI001E332063|nr:5-formyltetrahydrofolate cyclo-ligase [Eggerthella sp. YY7918]
MNCRMAHSDLPQEKARLRKLVLARRDGIPAEERDRRSRVLCERLSASCQPAVRPHAVIAAYHAFGSEPDMRHFLHEAYDRGCRVCLPCMVRENVDQLGKPCSRMVFLEVDRESFEACELPFLAQPTKALERDDPILAQFSVVEPTDIDVVVVPLVACDAANNRMGYGGGHYDRFLSEVRSDVLVVGVGFAEQMIEAVPLEAHDKALHRVVTA